MLKVMITKNDEVEEKDERRKRGTKMLNKLKQLMLNTVLLFFQTQEKEDERPKTSELNYAAPVQWFVASGSCGCWTTL